MKKLLFSLAVLSLTNISAQSWNAVSTGAPGLHIVNVLKIVDANTIWFSDTAASTATDTGRYIGLSTDGGTTWSNKLISGPVAAATIGDMHPVSATTAWIVSSGSGSQNGIWKSTDAGTTWTKQTTASFSTSLSFANVVHFWDANNGFAAGDPFGAGANQRFEMYTTTNGGTNWTNIATGTAPTPLNGSEFGYTSKITVLGDNIWLGTDLGRLLYSPNRGASWQTFQTNAIDFGGVTVEGFTADVAFKDTSNGLLLSNESDIAVLYSTANSGASWTLLEPNGPYYPYNIAYVPGTTNTYVTSGYEDGSSYSTDGGLNWTPIANGDAAYQSYAGSLAFLNSTTGFAGGVGGAVNNTSGLPYGGIYKFSGSFLAVSDVNSTKSKLTAFPNPASEVVNLKSTKDIKEVAIIDLSGKVVKREKTNSQVNVSNLSKGSYLLQAVYTDGSVENTKIIKK